MTLLKQPHPHFEKNMKQTTNNNFSRQFFGLGIVILSVIFAFGCGGTTAPANSNTTANSNTANTNTAVNNSASTPTNTNTASSNTTAAKSIKDEILGTWIQGESGSAKIKMVITKDEMTKFDNDKQDDVYKYTWLNDKEIELVIKGQKVPAKVMVKGDEMTLDIKELGPVPYKRESGNSSNTASTNSETSKKDEKSEEKGDCTVKADNSEFFISATEKTVNLKKGTQIQYVQFGNQGIAVVKAQIDGKWVNGEIQNDLLDCPDDGKGEKK